MAVTKADPKAASPATKADEAVTQTAAPEQETLTIELNRVDRYFYGNRLYVKGEAYIFGREDAMHMVQLRDPSGLPVFGLARKRVKLVPVEVDEHNVVTPLSKSEQRLNSVFDLVKDGVQVAPQPVAKIDLGDDDAEIAAKLANADAGEIDTAIKV